MVPNVGRILKNPEEKFISFLRRAAAVRWLGLWFLVVKFARGVYEHKELTVVRFLKRFVFHKGMVLYLSGRGTTECRFTGFSLLCNTIQKGNEKRWPEKQRERWERKIQRSRGGSTSHPAR